MYNINDKKLINDIENEFSKLIQDRQEDELKGYKFEHPLA